MNNSSNIGDDYDDATTQLLPTAFPKGYAAFYIMKYEISQQQYADFLNKLPPSAAANRYSNVWFDVGGYMISDTGALPEAYVTLTPERACGWLSWPDMAAYADWIGLRPMTELEYEKACRGPNTPAKDEYAWGNPNIALHLYVIMDQGLDNELVSNPGIGTGNATYDDTNGQSSDIPSRCGVYAASAVNKTREETGASYYGVMEFSGNMQELTITTGNTEGREFTGIHGDGVIDANGNADVGTTWPNVTTMPVGLGAGVRGGDGHGSTSGCYELKSNNTLFVGGSGNGGISVCYTAATSNIIFAGADGDGNASTCFTLISNNSIFAGGNADGNTASCLQEMPNNLIFAGTNGDGSESLCYTAASNNTIYAGGFGDGFDSRSFLDITNNQIFAGSEGDGYHSGEFSLHPPTIVWHGQVSSNWHNPGNWDQNRVPTINDLVIIRTEVHDPFIVDGWLGIGDQSSEIIEFAQQVYILNESSLTLNKTSRANIQQDLFVHGSFNSLYPIAEPVVHLFNGGTMTITSQGFVHLVSQ